MTCSRDSSPGGCLDVLLRGMTVDLIITLCCSVQKTLFADSVKGVPTCNAIRSLDALCTYALKETLDIFASASLRQNFQRYFNQCNVAYPPLSPPAPIALPGESAFIISALASLRNPLNGRFAEIFLTRESFKAFRISARQKECGALLAWHASCVEQHPKHWLSSSLKL